MQTIIVDITNSSCKCQIVANSLVTKSQISTSEYFQMVFKSLETQEYNVVILLLCSCETIKRACIDNNFRFEWW